MSSQTHGSLWRIMKVHRNAVRNHENASRPTKVHVLLRQTPWAFMDPRFMVNDENPCGMPMKLQSHFMVVNGRASKAHVNVMGIHGPPWRMTLLLLCFSHGSVMALP